MNTPRPDPKALMDMLSPELMKLCKGAPAYGELTLRAILADSKVGRICLGVEVLRKIEPQKEPIFTSNQSTNGQENGKAHAFQTHAKEDGHE